VILLDLDIPGGSGKEFLRRLGKNLAKYRIIVLTAHEEFLAAELAREFQVFRYLHKPSRLMESLRFTVSQAFNDLERTQLRDKTDFLIKIQHKINIDIQESKSNSSTQRALNEVLTLICESVLQLLGAYTVHIRVYNLHKGHFDLAAFAGPNREIAEIFGSPKRKGEPLSGTIASEQLSIHFEELQREQVFQTWKAQSLTHVQNTGNEQLRKVVEEYANKVQSAYVVPITTGLFADETDAVFNVSADTVSFFVPENQAIIKEFVGYAAAAITKAWQKFRQQDSHNDYRGISKVLDDISKEFRDEHAKRKIYDIVIKGISRIINPEAINIYLYNKLTRSLHHEAQFIGNQWQAGTDGYRADQGLTAFVYTEGAPLRMPNLQQGDRRKPNEHPGINRELYERSLRVLPSGRVDHYLAVPMIIGGEIVGAVELLNKKSESYLDENVHREYWLLERGFSDECENVLGIAASHLAVAIKNAELLEERRKQISQLAILKDVGRFKSSVSLSELLHNIFSEAVKEAQAEICLLFLVDESKTQLVLVESYGIPKVEFPEASYEIGNGITGQVAATGDSLLFTTDVPPGKYDEQVLRHLQRSYGQGKEIESAMIVPIKAGADVLGVIKMINKKGINQRYSYEDLKFFESFASYVGLALENKQDYEAAVSNLVAAEGNATLSHMVRAVLHEINNTQALIPLNIQLIRERIANSNFDLDPMIDVIDDVASQTLSFANSIQAFDISRLKEKRVHDLNEIISKAFSQVLPTLGKTPHHDRVEVRHQFSATPLRCEVYETPFIQVIQNIIVNAYQSMQNSETAQLTIASSRDTQRNVAVISFTDTGCGIDPKFLPNIFDANFTTKGRGTGIGLWLAKRHLDSIEATITVTSKLNEGTTFRLEVPLARG
jgi:signal transduction histidine kinase/CheY-like chemotaxis protein